jgi:hypothetical protein
MQGHVRKFDHRDNLDVEVAGVAGIECICSAGRV